MRRRTERPRPELIKEGKIWIVYPGSDSKSEDVLHEGSLNQCRNYINQHRLTAAYRSGSIRLAQVVVDYK